MASEKPKTVKFPRGSKPLPCLPAILLILALIPLTSHATLRAPHKHGSLTSSRAALRARNNVGSQLSFPRVLLSVLRRGAASAAAAAAAAASLHRHTQPGQPTLGAVPHHLAPSHTIPHHARTQALIVPWESSSHDEESKGIEGPQGTGALPQPATPAMSGLGDASGPHGFPANHPPATESGPALLTRHIRGTILYKITPSSPVLTLPGATVRCVDRDWCGGQDDFMCETQADATGAFACTFPQNPPCTCPWWDVLCMAACATCPHWDCAPASAPDVQCQISPNSERPLKIPIHRDVYYTPTHYDVSTEEDLDLGAVQLYVDRRNLTSPEKCLYAPMGFSNGCGPAPEGFGGLNIAGLIPELWFHEQCSQHDCCYSTCGMTQRACDDEFLALMLSKCAELACDFDVCYEAARAYRSVVSSIGGPAFAAAQSESSC